MWTWCYNTPTILWLSESLMKVIPETRGTKLDIRFHTSICLHINTTFSHWKCILVLKYLSICRLIKGGLRPPPFLLRFFVLVYLFGYVLVRLLGSAPLFKPISAGTPSFRRVWVEVSLRNCWKWHICIFWSWNEGPNWVQKEINRYKLASTPINQSINQCICRRRGPLVGNKEIVLYIYYLLLF